MRSSLGLNLARGAEPGRLPLILHGGSGEVVERAKPTTVGSLPELDGFPTPRRFLEASALDDRDLCTVLYHCRIFLAFNSCMSLSCGCSVQWYSSSGFPGLGMVKEQYLGGSILWLDP